MNKTIVKKNGATFLFNSPIPFYRKDLETAADAIIFCFINRHPGDWAAKSVLELLKPNTLTQIQSITLSGNGVYWNVTITPL